MGGGGEGSTYPQVLRFLAYLCNLYLNSILLYFRYNVVILLATYIFPIIAIGLITIHMTIVLWWRQPFSVVTPQLERAKSKKQKVMVFL